MVFDDLHRVINTYWTQFLYLLPKLGVALLLLIIAVFVANRLSRLIGGRLHGQSHDPLLAEFLTRLIKWALLLVGLMLCLQVLGMTGVVSGMVAGAGLTAFVVGFALKDIAENFLAGVVLAFNRPFRIHDTIQIKDNKELMGRVETLNLRTTLIKTFDGRHIYLPNALVLREALINFTRDGFIRPDFQVAVDIGPDGSSERVQQQIMEVVRAAPDVIDEPQHRPYITLDKAEGTVLTLHVYFWTSSEDYRRGVLELKSELMQAVRQHLGKQGYPKPATVS
ncbi:mechanosensitive ion channel [Hymenobacter gummosus]|uniref:Mechanosensitive ion channel n=1 Tax=Hymenobacter gummosus TaxID=1776032 RepID=A0A431U5I7_9BACT|nr:mechanosensitive ion channel domain-containing protein [Hymenobacter gummosus]RTQ51562.1 mechanosensitive ion channel [Hymenobacter gummosus]